MRPALSGTEARTEAQRQTESASSKSVFVWLSCTQWLASEKKDAGFPKICVNVLFPMSVEVRASKASGGRVDHELPVSSIAAGKSAVATGIVLPRTEMDTRFTVYQACTCCPFTVTPTIGV